MKEKLLKIAAEASSAISAADADLESLRIKYLGKKGELTAVLRGMGSLSAEERPVIGQLANDIRSEIEAKIAARREHAATEALERRLASERLDVTVPGTPTPVGHMHPISLVQRQLEEMSGVKQPQIARMERGDANPQLDTLLKVLAPLGKTLAIVPLKPRTTSN